MLKGATNKHVHGAADKNPKFSSFTDGARYNNLLPQLTQNPFNFCFDFFGQTRCATIQQLPQFGIGGVLWDCELVLSQYLVSQAKNGADKWNGVSFLELGAGTGLATIVAWLLGGVAIATDLPEVVTAAVTPNIMLNLNKSTNSSSLAKRKAQLAAANLSWGELSDCDSCQELLAKITKGFVGASPQQSINKKGGKDKNSVATADSAKLPGRQFDIILAADVIYHSDQHSPLLATMKKLMHHKSKLIFVHRRRFENDMNFVEPLLEMFTVTKSTPVAQVFPEYPRDNLTIYEFSIREKNEELNK